MAKFELEVITAQGKVLRAGKMGSIPQISLSISKLVPEAEVPVFQADGKTPVYYKLGYSSPGVPNMVQLMDHPAFMGLKAGDKISIEIKKVE